MCDVECDVTCVPWGGGGDKIYGCVLCVPVRLAGLFYLRWARGLHPPAPCVGGRIWGCGKRCVSTGGVGGIRWMCVMRSRAFGWAFFTSGGQGDCIPLHPASGEDLREEDVWDREGYVFWGILRLFFFFFVLEGETSLFSTVVEDQRGGKRNVCYD
ncbi:hypothetical protein SAMN02745702_01982 [Desulfobaculum bizertense DSM 18034]|uniref:Uncharacterized protein n=1 Tax=Desulfobaculum bizertense DSM 18034 TaxID=1121442 RepID=A0A1T4WBU8_9BACT|nr:hypothetical protein SAMN02745702_01982 [Desulfobaculum bizertense DSM 18034]